MDPDPGGKMSADPDLYSPSFPTLVSTVLVVMPIAHVFFVNEDSPIYLITMTDVFLSKYEEKDHFSARQAPTNLFSNWENEKANCLRIILII